MKRPTRQRPNNDRISKVRDANYKKLAENVRYEGSPKHKVRRVSDPLDGDPAKCPPDITPQQANKWLRQAVKNGSVQHEAGKTYPKAVWFRKDGNVYKGLITNATQGTYHGFPVWNKLQWPDGIDELWPDA